jgi:hypothetical protein
MNRKGIWLMHPRTFLASIILVLALGLLLPPGAPAKVVGHITQAEGWVDLLKGGKLPANRVKLQEGVEIGDVLRTKSLSRAQITFIDHSIVTLSPESRLAIDKYMFNPAQPKRNALLHLYRGLAHVMVHKLFKVDEPDFVIETHTAVTGVRGTDFGVRLGPNSTTILNFSGVTQVGNIFPEVGQLFPRAAKIAYAWGEGGRRWVILSAMQGTTVERGLPPTLPFTITPQDQQQFMQQLSSGLMSHRRNSGSGSAGATGSNSGSGSSGGSGRHTAGRGSAGIDGRGTGDTGAVVLSAGGWSGVDFLSKLGRSEVDSAQAFKTIGPQISSSTMIGSTTLPPTTASTPITLITPLDNRNQLPTLGGMNLPSRDPNLSGHLMLEIWR